MKIKPETIAVIKQLVDPEMVLDHLGFCIIRKTPKELRGPCKVHGGDNPTAFRFNLENKTWCCYTRHCEDNGDRDLVGLVRLVTQQPFVESVKFLADMCGVDLENTGELSEEFKKLRQEQAIRKEIRQSTSLAPNVTFYEDEDKILNLIPNRSSYFEDRGFSKGLLDYYEVGGMRDRYGIHRETIPIRDENGKLLTVSARRTDSNKDPKYILLRDFPKEATLYNLHVARKYTGEDRTLVLVEGFVDVWSLVSLGVYNVVAAMGTYITPNQAHLLWKYAENIIVMFDADKAGREATPTVVETLKLGAFVRAVYLPDGKDPKDFNYVDLKTYNIGESNDF